MRTSRAFLLAALVLFALGAVKSVYAQSEADVLSRLLQTPESTLALVALVLGVVSVTMFIRANAKATQEADRITNRILDQYEKSAAAANKNADAQQQVATGIREMVGVMSAEFKALRDAQQEQTDALRAQAVAMTQTVTDFKAYQTLMDDTVFGLRESVLKLVTRIGAIEERTAQISEKAMNAPGDHAKIINLLETLARDTQQQQSALLAYLEERKASETKDVA